MTTARPDNSHLTAVADAAVKQFVTHLTGPGQIPRTVLACALAQAIEEMMAAKPVPVHLSRVCVAEVVGRAYAAIAATLQFKEREKVDASVVKRMMEGVGS